MEKSLVVNGFRFQRFRSAVRGTSHFKLPSQKDHGRGAVGRIAERAEPFPACTATLALLLQHAGVGWGKLIGNVKTQPTGHGRGVKA